jgi:hypothetical protein
LGWIVDMPSLRALPRGLLAVVVLWLLGAALVGAGAVTDWRGRSSGPEAPLRTYLAAVTAEDLDAALLEIAPDARASAAPFVAEQLGNEYRVLGLGVRRPSILDRLVGGGPAADTALATVQLRIVLTTGEQWSTTAHVPLTLEDTGWYLARPPLQPTSDQ